jgi:Glycosyl hydrolases family 18
MLTFQPLQPIFNFVPRFCLPDAKSEIFFLYNFLLSPRDNRWTGSLYFSTLVQTASSRDAWSDVLVKAVEDYDLDGLNLDWEYPNNANGVACNAM